MTLTAKSQAAVEYDAVPEAGTRCSGLFKISIERDRQMAENERLREKLAELTTIANAIPPACGLARELVEQRIEGVKKEIQNNGN